MASTRASDDDRDKHVEEIEAAFADGRITNPERESRTQSALQATTLDQLARLVADLVPKPPGRPPSGPRRQPSKLTTHLWTRLSIRQKQALFLGTVASGLVVVFSLVAVLATSNDDAPSAVDDRRTLLTAAGFETFVDQTRDKFGTTLVDNAAVYRDHASVEIIRKDDPRRTERWSYSASNGYADQELSKSTRDEDDVAIDLADIVTASYARAVKRAPAVLGVEDITSQYVSIGDYADMPSYAVSVSNEYNETGYWTFTLAGEETNRYAFE